MEKVILVWRIEREKVKLSLKLRIPKIIYLSFWFAMKDYSSVLQPRKERGKPYHPKLSVFIFNLNMLSGFLNAI